MKKVLVLGAVLALLSASSQLAAQNYRAGRAASQGSSWGSGTTALWVGAVGVAAAALGAWGISSMNTNNAH